MLPSSDEESSPQLEEILSAELAVRHKVSRLKERPCCPPQMRSPVLILILSAELACSEGESRLSLGSFLFYMATQVLYGHSTVSFFKLLYDLFFICEGCEPEDSSDSLLPACRAHQGGIRSCLTGQYASLTPSVLGIRDILVRICTPD